MSILRISLGLLLIVGCLVQSALAVQCEQSVYAQDDYRLMLDEFASGACLKPENNQTPLGLQVKALLSDERYDDRIRAIQALAAVQAQLESEFLVQQNSQTGNARILNSAIEVLKNDMRETLQEKPDSNKNKLKQKWKLDRLDRLPAALEQLDFSTTLTASKCQKVADRQCDTEFEQAANLVRAIHLVNAALDQYTASYREMSVQDRMLRTAKWDSYYDDLTFQYPWELMANNWVLEWTDERAVVDGNKLGFRQLPEGKLVLLHPEVNLVYADNAQDKYDITLTVEALGFEMFDFNNKTGKVKNPWGVSLLAAYLERPDQTDSGWTGGLLFKYDGYSLGVTDNHGEVAVVFNINLAQKLFDVEQKRRKYYDEYEQRVQQLDILIKKAGQELEEAR